jgi:hypothetical protein
VGVSSSGTLQVEGVREQGPQESVSEGQEALEYCVIKCFIISTSLQILGLSAKLNYGGGCSIHGVDKWTQQFSRKALKEETTCDI